MTEAMPSTLHQKVKFMVEEQLINVATKEDIVAALSTSNSYIDVDENAIKCFFQSLEVVSATFVGEGKRISTPCLSKVIKMRVKQTVRKGSRPKFELGKCLQGASKVVLVTMKQDRYGLG